MSALQWTAAERLKLDLFPGQVLHGANSSQSTRGAKVSRGKRGARVSRGKRGATLGKAPEKKRIRSEREGECKALARLEVLLEKERKRSADLSAQLEKVQHKLNAQTIVAGYLRYKWEQAQLELQRLRG